MFSIRFSSSHFANRTLAVDPRHGHVPLHLRDRRDPADAGIVTHPDDLVKLSAKRTAERFLGPVVQGAYVMM